MNDQTQSQNQTDSNKKSDAIDPATALSVVLGTALGSAASPLGFTPLGEKIGDKIETLGINPAEIPQTMDQLSELRSFTYDLTVRRAAELNIPVVGNISGGLNKRVVIFEWTRFKGLFDEKGIEYRYGYVIRFCLTVSKWDVEGKLSLPFLSAQAELGNIQASWMMQVRGLTGQKIDSVVLPPQDLKVETFIIAKQSLDAAIKAISDTTTRFVPGIIVSKVDPTTEEMTYRLASVRAFAMYNLSRGRTNAATQARLGSADPAAADAITEVYSYFGIDDPSKEPSGIERENASRILGRIRADV